MSGTSGTPTLVLGGTGYVAGEILRLIAGHPRLHLAGILSDSKPGERVATAFPHLAVAYPDTTYLSLESTEELIRTTPELAVLAAAPHGVSAALIDRLLTVAESAGNRLRVVDISADYRFTQAEAYQAVYKHAHGAAHRLQQFTCALPEHLSRLNTPYVAHPGCFATAMLLALVPLMALQLVEPDFYVSGITGSTGSGRNPVEGTHHPRRHSDLYSYGALAHRHAPEVVGIVERLTGHTARLHFVPHSGPFARGIHATTQARLIRPMSSGEVREALAAFYADQPFVRVLEEAPRMKDIVGTNYAQITAAADGHSIAVMSVIDNLTKGAAGGAIQWLNRLYGWDQTLGLTLPASGWT